jgi:EmrB/QacA subfamily drug resistance transporter
MSPRDSFAATASAEPVLPTFSHRERVTVLFGLMLGFFLAALDQTIVATALPRMAADLHGVAHLSWVVSAYLLTSTAATPIYGKLSDLYGRRIMLQIAITIFLATSMLCAMAGTMGELIAFRALQGLGGGGLISMGHATIADIISPRERGRYQAYIASSFAIAAVVGPVVGGVFADDLSWRWVFWINLPLGIAALYMSQRTLKRLVTRNIRHRIDYLGAVLIVSAVCCILLVTTMGGDEVPWASPEIKGLTAAAIVLFALAVVQERSASEPILPPRLFTVRSFVVGNMVNMLASLLMFGAIVLIPLFLQMVFQLPAANSGLVLIPLTCVMSLAAIVTGRRVARTGRYKVYPAMGLVVTALGFLLLSMVSASSPLVYAAGVIALCGGGIGLVGPVMMVVIQNDVDYRDIGTATASISFFRSLGGSFGVALFTAVLISRLGALLVGIHGFAAVDEDAAIQLIRAGTLALSQVPPAVHAAVAGAMTGAFQDVFRVGAVIAAAAFGLVMLLHETPLKTTQPGSVPAGGDELV